MRGVIEHIPEFYKVIKTLFKSLKKKGIFLSQQLQTIYAYHILTILQNFI